MSQPKPLTTEEANRFRYHPATETTARFHDATRTLVRELAEDLTSIVPDGRHRSLMLTALQEAMMWANAGIACDTDEQQPVSI